MKDVREIFRYFTYKIFLFTFYEILASYMVMALITPGTIRANRDNELLQLLRWVRGEDYEEH